MNKKTFKKILLDPSGFFRLFFFTIFSFLLQSSSDLDLNKLNKVMTLIEIHSSFIECFEGDQPSSDAFKRIKLLLICPILCLDLRHYEYKSWLTIR